MCIDGKTAQDEGFKEEGDALELLAPLLASELSERVVPWWVKELAGGRRLERETVVAQADGGGRAQFPRL